MLKGIDKPKRHDKPHNESLYSWHLSDWHLKWMYAWNLDYLYNYWDLYY